MKPPAPQKYNPENRPKWFNSPVSFYEGTLSDISRHVPEFERRTFALAQPGETHTRINERMDTIVRKPTMDDPNFVPLGVVSKDYVLVTHREVVNIAAKAIKAVNLPPADVKAEITITDYGERMVLSLYLPEKYSFDPGDGHPLALRLECFNSVDGSTRFRALMGWFRFVCSNGLIIGVTSSDVRRRHIGDLGLSDVEAVLIYGINEYEKEKNNFKEWRNRSVQPNQLASWIKEELQKGWGFKAAARAHHISQTGYDAKVIGPYKDNTPITIPMRKAARVPGTPQESRNLYDISQILAWLARERRDVQEQLEWREQIPELLEPLMKA
jgi:hypothetical protein